MAGEVGARLQNDLPTKYGVELYLEEVAPTAQNREVPRLRALKALPRVFYFHPEEVAPFTEEMGYAPSGLWSVLIDGYPRARDPLIGGESDQEAIATWTRHTRSRIPPSRLSAVPRVRSSEGTEPT